MAKTNISQWDTVAGNNLDLNSISVAEGWLPSTVNNFEREEISQLAKFYDDFGGVNTVGGTANAITITTSTVFTALATGMRMRMVAGSSNSGATTLNLDAIGAKAVRKIVAGADVALVTGDILAGVGYDIVYSAAANSAAGGWIIVPLALDEGAWTPVLTFATPGNLNVVYTNQVGSYTKIGRGVWATCDITTSTFTFTTASGALQITGLPYTSRTLAGWVASSAVEFQGITKANYTSVSAQISSSGTTVTFNASGSGQTLSSVVAADTPTAGTVTLRFVLYYEVE